MSASTMVDYKDRYFDNLDKTLVRIESKVDTNTDLTKEVKAQAETTNGRVYKLEKEVFGKVARKDLVPIYKDPKVIQIALYLSLALLILVAAATRFDLGGLI